MKRVAIVGLGWLGMPLAMALAARGWEVSGSKTTPDGVDAARMCGVAAIQLELTPELICDADELEKMLTNIDALVITLPASRTAEGGERYMEAVQQIVNSALAFDVPRILFTSSTSVYGKGARVMKENSPLAPETVAGKTLVALESWLHDLPGTSVDILRLAGLVGPNRHPGRFLAGKTEVSDGNHGVNLVHLDDVVAAIVLLLQTPNSGHIYNLSASLHPARKQFYPAVAKQLGLTPPGFLPDKEGSGGKIIDGNKICHELGFEYSFADPAKMPLG